MAKDLYVQSNFNENIYIRRDDINGQQNFIYNCQVRNVETLPTEAGRFNQGCQIVVATTGAEFNNTALLGDTPVWVAVGGGGDTLYTADGQLTGARTVDQDGNNFLMAVDALGYSGTLEFTQTERRSSFQTKTTDRTKGGGFFNEIVFGSIHSAISQAFDTGAGEAASVNASSNGALEISATDSFRAKTPAVNASTATVGQVLTLQNATTGEVEYADAPSDKSEYIIIGASDETTALTTGTAKTTFRIPWTGTITGVRASVTTAPTDAVLTVDINKTGTGTILSTKITIDSTEKTSVTAATAPVISTAGVTDDDEYTIDIDTVGSTIAGTGLKVTIIGTRT